MLTLLCAVAGIAWGDTSTLNFTAACGGTGTADDGAVWTVTSDGAESTFDSTSGIHYGTSKTYVSYVSLNTSDISGTITKVVVNTRDAQGLAKVSVTVGGTSFTCSGSNTATNTSADYTFTGSGSGVIVVKIDRNSSLQKAIYVKSVVVTFDEGTTSQKTDIATISPIDDTSLEVGDKGNFTATITPATGLSSSDYTVSWSSTGSSLSVTENGGYEALSIGTATVTVTVTPNNTTNYNTVSKTFEVSVSEPVVATIYEKVTSTSQLVAGNEYILVAIDHNFAMGAPFGQGNKVRDYVPITISENKITINNEAVAVLTLGESDGNWTFLASDNNEYLAYTATDNQINSLASVTENAYWTITDNFELKNNKSSRFLRYNSNSPRFACYSSGQQTSVLFVKQGGQINTKSDPELSFGEVTSFIGYFNSDFDEEPELINPHDLEGIYYVSSDDEIASVDDETGDVFIGVTEGTVTITAKFDGNDEYNAGSASYTITVSRAEPELKVNNAPTSMLVGDVLELEWESFSNGEVTFSSNNEDAIMVDDDGVLYAVGAGTATITVSQEEHYEYKAGEVTFTVTVIDPENSKKYVKVTNPNQLKVGNKYIIVAEESDGGSYAMGTQSGQYRKAEPVVVSNNESNNEAYTDNAVELTLGGKAGMWTLEAENGMLCLVNLPENGGGKIESTADATDMQKSWRINEETFTVSNRENPYWFIQLNYNQGNNPRFACYRNTGNLDAACLYVKAPYTTDDEFHADPLFSINNIIVEMGDNNRQLGVNTPSDGKNNISFTFDDNSIAEIVNNNDGTYTVNPLAVGETTVEAALPQTSQYESADATFTIKVVGQFDELASDVYQKVTSNDDLTSGKYLIVYEAGSLVLDGNRETLDATSNFKEVTITDDKIYCPGSYFIIDVESGTIQSQSGLYIGAKSSNTNIQQTDDVETYTHTFAIDENDGALIKAVYTDSKKYLRFNNNKDQMRFRYYNDDNNGSHTQQPIQLYKAIVENTFDFNISEQATDGTDHYATIADLGMGYFKVTGGVDVYTVVVVGDKLSFPIHFSDGDAIPGDGAYLVKGNARPDPADPYKFPATISPDEEVDLGENMLHSTGEGNLSAEDMAAAYDPDTKFYKLSLYKGKVGFFWGEEGGAAFNYTKPHQAYLALEPAKIAEPGGESGSQNISGFYFDGTTAISEMLSESSTDNATYTLSGIRVDGKNLPKGIYIVNGKKVVIK